MDVSGKTKQKLSQTRHQTENRREEEISTYTQACSIKAESKPAAAAQDGEENDAATDKGGQRGVKDVMSFSFILFLQHKPLSSCSRRPGRQSAGLDWLADLSVTMRDGQMT